MKPKYKLNDTVWFIEKNYSQYDIRMGLVVEVRTKQTEDSGFITYGVQAVSDSKPARMIREDWLYESAAAAERIKQRNNWR